MRVAVPLLLALALVPTACGSTLPSGSGDLEGAARGSASASGSMSATVDPGGCGDYASSSDLGARIKLFLEATVRLQDAVTDLANYVRDTCVMMGQQLGMGEDALSVDTPELCAAVRSELEGNLQVSVQSNAALDLKVEPARCEVVAAAEATAEGACAGQAGTGTGARAECEGYAGVEANVEARCEPARVEVDAAAEIVVDAAKLELALAAIRVGLPRLLEAHARATGPTRAALEQWAAAVQDLQDAQQDYFSALGAQAVCVTGQIAKAFSALADIRAQVKVSIDVSVELSGAAGASI